MSNSTPKKKLCARLTSALFFSPTCVFVCDYFYLNKKNEAERHLGSGTRREVALPGFRPTIKNAVKFSIFFFASRRRLFFFFFSPKGFFHYPSPLAHVIPSDISTLYSFLRVWYASLSPL